ncbi:hypothetical protein [Lacinutrix chionoecetis]
MSTLVYKKTKSHGNVNTPASGAGMDKLKFKIPNNEKFSHYTISQASGHTGTATFIVVGAPKKNATGNAEIRVLWTNGPFSKCRYTLKVYSYKPSSVTVPIIKPIVIFGNANWFNDALSFMKQKTPFILRVQGVDAIKLFNALNPINHSILRRNIIINEPVLVPMTIAICITIIALGGFALLGAVLLYGINQGCSIKVKYDTNLSLFGNLKQLMDFEFMNCGG